jgi:DNA-binding transcriptional ArsR family regulator
MTISRDDATTWAGWFKALGDPTRILILHLLATGARPMTTGEIVDALDVGQSTVSHHLQILGETCFVHVERAGTTSWWRINDRCLTCFPSAAELVMGRLPTTVPWDDPEAGGASGAARQPSPVGSGRPNRASDALDQRASSVTSRPNQAGGTKPAAAAAEGNSTSTTRKPASAPA